MKKPRICMILAALALPLMGCDGSRSYHAVHIYGFGSRGFDMSIKSWRDVDKGIEVDTEAYGTMLLSEGTYILLRGIRDCPICR